MNSKRSKFLCVFLLCMFTISGAGAAKKIKVAFGDALAPWVMPEKNHGIIVDIIEEAMSPLGYEVERVYLPYARRIKSYQQGLVDVVSDINPNTFKQVELKGFLSDIAYTYVNYAYSLKKRNFTFKRMGDLVDYRVLSWQGAVEHLSEEYATMARNNPFYSEHHDQSLQVKMLFLERVDVIQMDQQIFKYYRAIVGKQGNIDTNSEVDVFDFFGESPNSYLFSDSNMRDEFNVQLKKLKASGRYEAILNQYILRSVK